jgi:hypothetical protein
MGRPTRIGDDHRSTHRSSCRKSCMSVLEQNRNFSQISCSILQYHISWRSVRRLSSRYVRKYNLNVCNWLSTGMRKCVKRNLSHAISWSSYFALKKSYRLKFWDKYFCVNMKKEMQVIQSCLPVDVGKWKEVAYEPNIAQSYVAMNLTIDLSLRIRYSF